MMTLSSNGTLAVHRGDRAIIIGHVTGADRVNGLIATGRAPVAAALIVNAGAPTMYASAVSLVGFHDALDSVALSTDEIEEVIRWRSRRH